MKSFHFILLLTLVAMILGGGWLAIGENERADQLLRDGRYEAARALLESRFAREFYPSKRTMLNLYYARMAAGDLPQAIDLIKSIPLDDAPQQELKTALRSSFDMPAYEQLLTSLKDNQSLREHAHLSRLQGNSKRTEEILGQLAAKNQITSQELIQLAALKSRSGNIQQAIQYIRKAEKIVPKKERNGLFLIELKLMAQDRSIKDVDFLARVKDVVGQESQSEFSQQILWNLIKLNRPELSLRLIENPFKDGETFNAFVAAKESADQTDDIVPTLLTNPQLNKASEAQLKLIVRYAPDSPENVEAVLARYEKGELALNEKQLLQLAYTSMQKSPETTRSAEAVFKKLAEKHGSQHQSAKGLRYLWGPRPNAEAIAWIRQQSLQDKGADRLEWIRYLLSSAQYEMALTILRASDYGTLKGATAMIVRLLPMVRSTQAKADLLALIEKNEKNSALLLKTARVAKDSELFDHANSLALEAMRHDSKSGKALAFLGILAAQRDEPEMAVKMLGDLTGNSAKMQTLSNYEKVQTQFLYASSLEQTNKPEKAKVIYQNALATLRDVYSKDFDLSLQAELLAKVEGPTQGAKLLQAHQRIKPLSPSERILLGRLLTDSGDLKAAQEVLFNQGDEK